MKEKREFYRMLRLQLHALICNEDDWLANLSNTCALVFQGLEEINWCGFYLLKHNQLVLGPFQGRVACVRIPIGRGVCGSAAQTQKTYLVPDVHQFPGHIACDPNSRSEIVIPLIIDGKVLGVLDIDSPIMNRFDSMDQQGLEAIAQVIVTEIDWTFMQ